MPSLLSKVFNLTRSSRCLVCDQNDDRHKSFDDILYQIRGSKLWLRVREAESGEEIAGNILQLVPS